MAVGDIYRVVLKGVNKASEATYNVFHFRGEVSTPDPDALVEEFVDALMSASTDGVLNILPSSDGYTLSEVSYQVISPTLGAAITHTLSSARHGKSGNNGILPACCVVKWTTAAGGRSYRGRSYFGPVAEDIYTDGVIGSAGVTAVGVGCQNVLDLYGPSGSSTDWRLVVWSRKLSVETVVTGFAVRSNAKTQRRRQRGVGG